MGLPAPIAHRMSALTENSSGVPKAPFHEDVLKLIDPGQTPESTIGAFRHLASKYEMMINNLAIRERRITQKIDEIKESIAAIDHMAANADKTLTLDYELGDTLYAKANVAPGAKVHLWLGANILLEYELDEAKSLLETKLKDNQSALERIRHDQKFTREQLTVVEVSVSRLVNHLIETRKK